MFKLIININHFKFNKAINVEYSLIPFNAYIFCRVSKRNSSSAQTMITIMSQSLYPNNLFNSAISKFEKN